jgi:hypothetical protein
LKDIENSMPQSAAALARLERALARLDLAAARPRTMSEPALAGELGRLKTEHAALKDAATRVANRLDAAIDRLSATVYYGA